MLPHLVGDFAFQITNRCCKFRRRLCSSPFCMGLWFSKGSTELFFGFGDSCSEGFASSGWFGSRVAAVEGNCVYVARLGVDRWYFREGVLV